MIKRLVPVVKDPDLLVVIVPRLLNVRRHETRDSMPPLNGLTAFSLPQPMAI
jgi:hypothetical protein